VEILKPKFGMGQACGSGTLNLFSLWIELDRPA
jgi:hypothetical protein